MRRLFLRILPLVLAGTLLTGIGAGVSDARPTEAPRLNLYSDTMWVVGPGGCAGPVRISLKTDPAQRGKVFATFIPGRFNKPCKHRVWSSWVGAPFHWSPLMNVGPRGGKAVKKTLRTGSGLLQMRFGYPGYPGQQVTSYLVVP